MTGITFHTKRRRQLRNGEILVRNPSQRRLTVNNYKHDMKKECRWVVLSALCLLSQATLCDSIASCLHLKNSFDARIYFHFTAIAEKEEARKSRKKTQNSLRKPNGTEIFDLAFPLDFFSPLNSFFWIAIIATNRWAKKKGKRSRIQSRNHNNAHILSTKLNKYWLNSSSQLHRYTLARRFYFMLNIFAIFLFWFP